jgi:hypothetical protein
VWRPTAYAARQGHLSPDKLTQHDGFPLGRWLSQQRRKARVGVLSSTTIEPLTALDSWITARAITTRWYDH